MGLYGEMSDGEEVSAETKLLASRLLEAISALDPRLGDEIARAQALAEHVDQLREIWTRDMPRPAFGDFMRDLRNVCRLYKNLADAQPKAPPPVEKRSSEETVEIPAITNAELAAAQGAE